MAGVIFEVRFDRAELVGWGALEAGEATGELAEGLGLDALELAVAGATVRVRRPDVRWLQRADRQLAGRPVVRSSA